MSTNKNSHNAFYFFMQDWKKQEELKGRTFQRGFRDVQADSKCQDDWNNLPAAKKILYKQKEKNNKGKMKMNKKTCLGESSEEVEKSELKKIEFMDEMKRCVSTIIAEAAGNRCIKELKFHVVHVNHLYRCICDDSENVYYPVEVGIAEFSLEKGITRIYHKIVKSEVKTGYASAVIEHSKNTHQIPKDLGESDYGVVYKEIIKFLESSRCNGKLPPLYSLYYKEDVKYPVLCGLKLFANSQEDSENFIIYSFEELFVNLRNITMEDDDLTKFDNVIVSIKLTEDPYDYRKNLACEYHKESGGDNYCSKSIVQRWIFVLCSFTCPLFSIDLIPGFHKPVEDENIPGIIQLNNSFKKMNLPKNEFHNENQPKHPSERTWADEKKRRSEAIANPIQIVDHSIINSTQNFPVALQKKPVDPPFTKPIRLYTEDCVEIIYDERDFPSIGRGSWIKNQGGNERRLRRPQNRE